VTYNGAMEYTHAKMASHMRDTYQIDPITYAPFMFELDDEYKIMK